MIGQTAGAAGSYASSEIFMDGSTAASYGYTQNYNAYAIATSSGAKRVMLPAGYHYFQVYESSNHNSSYFFAMIMDFSVMI